MLPINHENVEFERSRIVIHTTKGQDGVIELKDIWTMFYAKWSIMNYFTIGHDGFGMGILYIAKKNTMKRKDIYQIKISYQSLKTIPGDFFKKIEFYEFGIIPKISSINRF